MGGTGRGSWCYGQPCCGSSSSRIATSKGITKDSSIDTMRWLDAPIETFCANFLHNMAFVHVPIHCFDRLWLRVVSSVIGAFAAAASSPWLYTILCVPASCLCHLVLRPHVVCSGTCKFPIRGYRQNRPSGVRAAGHASPAGPHISRHGGGLFGKRTRPGTQT